MERHNMERKSTNSSVSPLLSPPPRPTFAPSTPKKLLIPPPHCQEGGTAAEHVGGEFSGRRRHRFSGLELSLPSPLPTSSCRGGFLELCAPPSLITFSADLQREKKKKKKERQHTDTVQQKEVGKEPKKHSPVPSYALR